jgi:hypothetical protein
MCHQVELKVGRTVFFLCFRGQIPVLKWFRVFKIQATKHKQGAHVRHNARETASRG